MPNLCLYSSSISSKCFKTIPARSFPSISLTGIFPGACASSMARGVKVDRVIRQARDQIVWIPLTKEKIYDELLAKKDAEKI